MTARVKKGFRIQYETADGIKQYDRIERPEREIYRVCMRIVRFNGEDRVTDPFSTSIEMTKRKYLLWTQKPNGTLVYLEDL